MRLLTARSALLIILDNALIRVHGLDKLRLVYTCLINSACNIRGTAWRHAINNYFWVIIIIISSNAI